MKYSRRCYDLWVDELSEEKYWLLTLGFIKNTSKVNSVDIPAEIIRICHDFAYYHKYWVTFIWNKNGKKEEATIKLMTAKDINFDLNAPYTRTIWMKRRFFEAFNFVDAHGEDLMDYLNSWDVIKIFIKPSMNRKSRVIQVEMDAKRGNRYYMYAAKYKDEIKRIACGEKYAYWRHMSVKNKERKSLQFVLKSVKNALKF